MELNLIIGLITLFIGVPFLFGLITEGQSFEETDIEIKKHGVIGSIVALQVEFKNDICIDKFRDSFKKIGIAFTWALAIVVFIVWMIITGYWIIMLLRLPFKLLRLVVIDPDKEHI